MVVCFRRIAVGRPRATAPRGRLSSFDTPAAPDLMQKAHILTDN